MLAPFGELNTSRLALNIQVSESSQSTTGQTATFNMDAATALVVDKNTLLPVNSSVCYISTLEVYRGREQAFKISHDGFTLSDNNTIEVTKISFTIYWHYV